MQQSIESFINEEVIPRNWEVLSSRFDTTKFSVFAQRMKIIGEILEFYEAIADYRQTRSQHSFAIALDELADICIASCTLIRLQDRKYLQKTVPLRSSEEEWIRLVINRRIDVLLSTVLEYAGMFSVDIRQIILRKIEYNMIRTDW